MGPKDRVITFRKSLLVRTKCAALDRIKLKFIDTSSKFMVMVMVVSKRKETRVT